MQPQVVLYFVRHGESTGNREGVLQGQMDYPLTDTGRAQAVATGRLLRAEAEEALGTSGSAATSFFHRIWSSDLSRALETTRLVVRELLAPESTEPGQADARIAIDKNLREILGGVREGRRLGMTIKEATRQAAKEQGLPLDAFVVPPYETARDLHRRARRFVERTLSEIHAGLSGDDDKDPPPIPPHQRRQKSRDTAASVGLALVSPFRKNGRWGWGQPKEEEGKEGGMVEEEEEEEREGSAAGPTLPIRILVVSHGGLLLQMFQKVFGFHAVTRVLNASVTVVEARLPSTTTSTAPTPNGSRNNNRRRLALIFASPGSSRVVGKNGEEAEAEDAPSSLVVGATTFRPLRINDVKHLEALRIVTTKSTAL